MKAAGLVALWACGACVSRLPGEGTPAAAQAARAPVVFSDSGYVEVDGRLRLALPEMVRQDAQGRTRQQNEVLEPCVREDAGGGALPLVDRAVPRALCVVHMRAAADAAAFLRVYVDAASTAAETTKSLTRQLPAAARDLGARGAQVTPLAHGGWAGLRVRLETHEGTARAATEADLIIVPRAGGGVFVVASSVFDASRLEISQREPTR